MFKTFLAVAGGVFVGGAALEIANGLYIAHKVKKVVDAFGGWAKVADEFKRQAQAAAESPSQSAA